MKFQDIPQFPSTHYEIDVPWTHIDDHLDLLRGEGELRLDPDYQRAHVWSKKQQTSYVEYQLRGGDISRSILFNAPYWNKIQTPVQETYLELLDGKQRLEAVRAFLRGDIAAFGHNISEFEGRFPTMHYRFRFQVCCLETREEVLELYLKINAGGTPHTKKELNRVAQLLEAARASR